MHTQRWITSEGGPLIAVERELQAFWGGICRLTVPTPGASNDYDRPPERLHYIQTIDLQHGKGLIFGEGPVDTTFWQESDQHIFIVRTIYCNPDFDVEIMMRNLDRSLFTNTVEQINFTFFSGDVVMFDSAEDGSRSDVVSIGATICPGRYIIKTILHEPDNTSCLIIHELTEGNV